MNSLSQKSKIFASSLKTREPRALPRQIDHPTMRQIPNCRFLQAGAFALQRIKLRFTFYAYLDIPRKGDIIIDESQNKLSLRGAGRIRLRVGYRCPDPRT